MIRLLIIGREAAAWGEDLQQRAGDQLDLDTARLPAAGLRQFEATPPDAVVIVDAASARRAATLVSALRERPIGQLIPVIVIAPPAGEEEAAQVDAWLSPGADPSRLAKAVEDSLGVELVAETPTREFDTPPPTTQRAPWDEPAQPTTPARDTQPYGNHRQQSRQDRAPQTSQQSQPAYFIEEIDDDWDRPRRMKREEIFPQSNSRVARRPVDEDALGEEAIKRKLRAVRHEDYYAILEIRRGAEGAVVRDAFHRLYRRFDPQKIDFGLSQRFEGELAEIRDALEDAWAVLGDPKLRDAYLEHTTRR